MAAQGLLPRLGCEHHQYCAHHIQREVPASELLANGLLDWGKLGKIWKNIWKMRRIASVGYEELEYEV
jgi:hypothetical protein